MKSYYRVILGAKNIHAKECHDGAFIGADFDIYEDLSNSLPENWRDFNEKYREIWLKINPKKSKISAGLACGMLWTICKGIKIGDIVLCPDGNGNYYVGEIASNYYYQIGQNLPHRRKVKWFESTIERGAMSTELKNSTGSGGTSALITSHGEEIEKLLGVDQVPVLLSNDATIENPSAFALEKHLEEFLVKNWKQTILGKTYNIFEEEGELVGQQYPSDTGPIDILAISKDRKTLLVVELKKGRVSDNVLGQIQRYMGYVKHELAEPYQEVKGIIIGLEDDIKIKRALSITQNIDFYRYQITFELHQT